MRILFFILFLSSCSAMHQSLNLSYLNHPGMNLKDRSTPAVTGKVTMLNASGARSQAGCATCAK